MNLDDHAFQALSSEQMDLCRHLFASVEFDVPPPRDEPYRWSSGDGCKQNILIRGTGLALLQQLVRQLGGDSFAGSLRTHEVERLLIAAAHERRADDALAFLITELARPVETWTVITALSGSVRERDITIGKCEVRHEYDIAQGREESERFLPDLLEYVSPPVLLTRVRARTGEAARLLAEENFAEARAILAVPSGTISRIYPPSLYEGTDSVLPGAYPEGRSYLNAWRAVNPASELDYPDFIQGYQQLSDQAALDPALREDWPRRVLASARWLHMAREATWVAHALVSTMAGLECLLLRGKSERDKGRLLALRLTRWHCLPEFSGAPDRQEGWINSLYQDRNAAAHEGRSVLRDSDADRLLDLFHALVVWGIRHLDPFHIDPFVAGNDVGSQRPCWTFDEVFDAARHGAESSITASRGA